MTSEQQHFLKYAKAQQAALKVMRLVIHGSSLSTVLCLFWARNSTNYVGLLILFVINVALAITAWRTSSLVNKYEATIMLLEAHLRTPQMATREWKPLLVQRFVEFDNEDNAVYELTNILKTLMGDYSKKDS
jgi:hypothetical protein